MAIRAAIGAGRWRLAAQSLTESLLLAGMGGVLGVALGWVIGHAINFGTDIYLKQQGMRPETFWAVPWWMVAVAIGFSILVSLGSGLYPAARAAKLDPVQALRYE